MESTNMNQKAFIPVIAIIIFTAIMSVFSFYTVQPGFTALQLRMGKIIAAEEISGIKFKMPFIDKIIYIDTRISKAREQTTALSRDLQTVNVGMVINYRIINPLELYRNIGTRFKGVVIDPFSQESVKAIIAQFTAEDLIQSRHIAKDKVLNDLRSRLKPLYIELVDFNFTHLDFSPEFIKAVEDKQIAEQSAKTAKNFSEVVKEEANQTRTRAEAEAYSLKVKRESITPELISLKEVEAQIKAVEKWDGILPLYTGNSTPLITLPSVK